MAQPDKYYELYEVQNRKDVCDYGKFRVRIHNYRKRPKKEPSHEETISFLSPLRTNGLTLEKIGSQIDVLLLERQSLARDIKTRPRRYIIARKIKSLRTMRKRIKKEPV